jgi:pimeloyl-ACP methyl ester carboxylesterase
MTKRIFVVPGMAVREYARPACEAVEARGHRVELLKAPSWRGVPVGLDDYGYRIAEEFESKKVDVDLLIGLSVGTQVVAAAATRTDRVRNVMLISPTFDPNIRSMRGTMSRWFERGEGDDQSDWGRQLRDWTHTDPVRIARALRSALRSELEDVLPHVRSNLIVVHAEHDRMSRPEWVESLAVENNGSYHYQPGGKHSWPVEDVETFADYVDEVIGA